MMRWRLAVASVCALVLSVGAALTATNTVASSRLGENRRGVTANDLKPPECAALNLTTVVAGTGNVNGTGANDLIVGGPGDDKLKGKGGNDCMLGGGGDDDIAGNGGGDICIGGPGVDTFKSCAVTYP
jgi:Ca2+-binding RTX toxin-like protein